MQKIRVTQIFNQDIETVFNAISDHARFLSGGGLKCTLIQEGIEDINGNGAVRKVVSKNLTFEEKIFEFQQNKHFAYVIIATEPKKPLFHKKGWLDFTEVYGKTQVDWHSHFNITIPLIGGIIAWFAKKQMSDVFEKRLKYIEQNLSTVA